MGKKVKIQTESCVKEKMKLVREEENKDEFVDIFENEVAEFRAHVNRIKNQYTQLRQPKAQPDAGRNKYKDADANLSIDLKEEDFVAAVYSEDYQIYIRKVLEVDEDDNLISFMHHGNSKRLDLNSVLKWSGQSDEVWIITEMMFRA